MSEVILIEKKDEKRSKRIVAFDFLRGCAMIGVLAFHVLGLTYDYKARFDYDVIPVPFYILVIVLAFFGSMYPLFILISGIGNTISMEKQWSKLVPEESDQNVRNVAFWKILKNQLLRGGLLVFFGYLAESVFNGFLLDLLIPLPMEEVIADCISGLMHSQILSMIGWGIIFSSIVYLIMKKKNISAQKIVTFLVIIGVIIIIFTPFMVELSRLNTDFWDDIDDNFINRNPILNILYWFGSQWVLGWFPLFPNLSLSFFGIAIGMKMAGGKITKQFLNRIVLASIIIFIVGLIVVLLDLNYRYLKDMLIPTAGSLLSLVIFVYFVDIRGKGVKFAEKTVFFRRFSSLTLTIWLFQWLLILPLKMFHFFADSVGGITTSFADGSIYNGWLNGWWTTGIVIFIIFLWALLLKLWEKVQFIGSFEWLTVKILSIGRAEKSDRVNLYNSLYNIDSIVENGSDFYGKGCKILLFFIYLVYMIGNAVALLA